MARQLDGIMARQLHCSPNIYNVKSDSDEMIAIVYNNVQGVTFAWSILSETNEDKLFAHVCITFSKTILTKHRAQKSYSLATARRRGRSIAITGRRLA